MTPDLLTLLRVLSTAGVDYIIVGGVAGNLHGALPAPTNAGVISSDITPR